MLTVMMALMTAGALAAEGPPVPPTIGLGGGFTMPSSVLAPNTASLRWRLSQTLTIEPGVVISVGSGEDTVSTRSSGQSQTANTTTTELKSSSFGVSGLARISMGRRTGAELQALAGASLVRDSSSSDPSGDDDTTTAESLSLDVSGGVGVEHFLSSHASISADGLVNVLSMSSSRVENEARRQTQESSFSSIGLVFTPAVRLQFHLYY